jgi:hypothetical protein
MLVNQYNFLRFDDGTGTDPEVLPQAYIRERCQYPFMPILVPGESLAFYINSRYGYDYGVTLYLEFVKRGQVVHTDTTSLQKDVIDVDHYNLYADFTIPALDDGVYTLRVVNPAGTVFLTSNEMLCMNSDYENVSSYLEFTNDQNLYNVRYAELANFYQKFRLRITDVTGGDYEQNNESYMSVTSGRYRDALSIPQRYYTFECYYFDAYAFEALACFLAHRTRIINEREYAFKENLSHDPILMTKVAKGTFQMYDQEFSTINKCTENSASS